MCADVNESPPESRNAQSACNEADFARLLAEKLENKNLESQCDEGSTLKPAVPPPSQPAQTSSKMANPELVATYDVGLSSSFEEGKEHKRTSV